LEFGIGLEEFLASIEDSVPSKSYCVWYDFDFKKSSVSSERYVVDMHVLVFITWFTVVCWAGVIACLVSRARVYGMGRVLSPVARGLRRGWIAVWERDGGDAKAAGELGWVRSGVALGFCRGDWRGAAGDFPKGVVCRDNFRSISP